MKRCKVFSTKTKQILITSVAALLVTACGGTGQDDGSVSNFTQKYSGVALDGYLARATVYIDTNNNAIRDSWEAWAFTDNDGYYSYNPLTKTDYCAATATEQQRQYCLASNVEHSNVVVRIDSGYDVITGEPFLGQMSRRVDATDQNNVTNSVVSPLTSLLTNVETESDRNSLLTALNISNDDLNVDYLNTNGDATGNGGIDSSLLNASLKVHKVVTVLSDRLTDTYDKIGDEGGTPSDATSLLYQNLAQELVTSGNTLDVTLGDATALVNVLDASEANLRSIYKDSDLTLPVDIGSATNRSAIERVINITNNIPSVVNTLIDPAGIALTLSEATGSTRALETLVIKTVNEKASAEDNSIDNAIAFFDNQLGANQALIDALVTSLSNDAADITSLAATDFDFNSVEEITSAATLPDEAEAFTQTGGKQLRISNLDLGSAPNKVDDVEVELYFNGASNDIDGSFTACVKFIEGANSDTGALGEGNTRGELIDGFWSLLGATTDDVEAYSMLITLTFLGTTYQAIMKPAGMETVADVEYNAIRFDFDGDLVTWHSAEGMVETESVPATNEACQQRLPSRVGL